MYSGMLWNTDPVEESEWSCWHVTDTISFLSGCGVCKRMMPSYQQAATELKGKYVSEKIRFIFKKSFFFKENIFNNLLNI